MLLSNLVGALTDPISGWVVVADPDFMVPVSGDRASYLPRVAPDDLRVVPAPGPAGICAITIVVRFGGPTGHDFGR